MKFYQLRKYYMLNRLKSFLKMNRERFVEKVPALDDVIGDYIAKFEVLFKLQLGTINAVPIATGKKQSICDGYIDSILTLSGMLEAAHYKSADSAKKSKNASAPPARKKDLFHYTRSDLVRAKADDLVKIGKEVIAASKKIKFSKRYGVTAEDIKDADTYYKEFSGVKKGPTKRKKEVASKNKAIEAVMADMMNLLKKSMDPLMRNATKDDPEMRTAYKGFRTVLPRGPGAISDKEQRYRKSRERKEKKNEANGEAGESPEV